MKIDRDTLLRRRAELEANKDQVLGQLNATVGAIAEVDYWLSIIDKHVGEKDK